jgi:hypothetical protein
MGSVSTSYISFVYPSSTMYVPTNVFLMPNPTLTSGMTSGGNQFSNMGNPPHGVHSSGGNVYPHMGNSYHIIYSSQAVPSVMMPLQPFMDQLGGGYYPIGQGHGVYQNLPRPRVSQSQNFLGAWSQMSQPRLPFMATLNLPELSRLMNDRVCHDLAWPPVPVDFSII